MKTEAIICLFAALLFAACGDKPKTQANFGKTENTDRAITYNNESCDADIPFPCANQYDRIDSAITYSSESCGEGISCTNEYENIDSIIAYENGRHDRDIPCANQSDSEVESWEDTTTFEGLYKALCLLPLPLSLSQVEMCTSTKFTKVPKRLISIFEIINYYHEYYDTNILSVAKLSEYKNFKLIVANVSRSSDGQNELLLCTFLDNTIIDWLTIYTAGDAEYNGRTDALYKTSFSITPTYEITIKTALYPAPWSEEYEIDAMQYTRIIETDGKFVENPVQKEDL
jgi:hypothetical protein